MVPALRERVRAERALLSACTCGLEDERTRTSRRSVEKAGQNCSQTQITREPSFSFASFLIGWE